MNSIRALLIKHEDWFSVPAVHQSRLEAIQWVAFVSMVIDHLGAFIFQQDIWLRSLGRFAFPLFALVFAWRLADSLKRNPQKNFQPMLKKLFVSGLFAQLLFMAATVTAWVIPMNIMFSFIAAILILSLCMKDRQFLGLSWTTRIGLAMLVLGYSSANVDYNGWGILLMLSLFSYFRWDNKESLIFAVMNVFFIAFAIEIHLAVLSIPLAILLVKAPENYLQASKPYPLLFYWAYPFHLFVIMLTAVLLAPKTV